MKTASTLIHLADPAAVLEALTGHMAEHEVELFVEDEAVRARIASGEAVIRTGSGALALEARAPTDADLEDIAGFLASHVREFASPQRLEIDWSGLEVRGVPSDFREMRVVEVTDLTSTMRRVRLSGKDLARFAEDENLHVRLFFPPPGHEPLWPMLGRDGLLEEPRNPARKPLVRKYTIRRIDAASGWVDIDFVLHDEPGPGSDWARRAAPGKLIGMAGPGGRSARMADWMLLAGDETALPAIARILEGLPQSTRGIAIIETHGDVIHLEGPEGFEIRWLSGNECSPSLADAVCATPVPGTGGRFCWVSAEFETVQTIRHHWRNSCALDKSEQLAVAYWRKGTPDA